MRPTSLLCLSVPFVLQAQAAPRLTVDAPSYDFGKVARGSDVKHRFVLRNTGSEPVKILRVQPTCGCTSGLLGKEVLAPGESTEVEITFHTAGMIGVVHKAVDVESDDPAAARLTLRFSADVGAVVTASTDTVFFQDLGRKERRKSSVRLVSGTGKPIFVSDVVLSKAPWLGVATRPEGNDEWVDLDLLASRLPAGKLSGTDTVELHLNNPGASVVNLTVRWSLTPPVTVDPARIAWSTSAGAELRASLHLQSVDHKPFRVLSWRATNPLLKVAGSGAPAASNQDLHVSFAATASPGTYDEGLFLTLDTPGHPEMEVRVVASLR
jgi:hypothetical protein